MYTVSLNDAERYYLRLLLLHVKGATSFQYLRTVENKVFSTFKEAAIERHLLADDKEWEDAISEAESFQMPPQLRQLFAYICVFGPPKDPRSLWFKFLSAFTEDYVKKGYKDSAESLAMRDVEDIFRLHGKNYKDFNLPKPSAYAATHFFDSAKERNHGERYKSMLNREQKIAFETIMSAIHNPKSDNCFFLDGPGGSGKTFLYNTLMSVLRGENKIIIPVASTGIAATLLAGGRTYHSQFKLPIQLRENSTSNMRPNSEDAKSLKNASLIIWDESPMATHHAVDAVDRLFKDLMDNDLPFGGKVMLLGGDFRQCLPVVKHASRVAIVQSSIKYSRLWNSFKQLKLSRNMRTSDGSKEFNEWLIKLGDGKLPHHKIVDGAIEIPPEFIIEDSVIDFIYGQQFSAQDVECLSDRAILCPKNDSTSEINDEIVERLEGVSKTYISIDTVESENDSERVAYPVEVLNSLTLSGLPPHKLTLKNGCIIMLLRNLNTRAGLCNGTRLIVRELKNNVIIANILKEKALGQRVFIPRIDLIPSDDEFPVTIKRRQFPIRLAFAMTINKSQGQTFDRVGIYLRTPVFSHGQLYVAFSRVKSKDNIRIQIEESERQGKIESKSDKVFTINCVYGEIYGDQQYYESQKVSEKTIKVFPSIKPGVKYDPNLDSGSTEVYYDSEATEEYYSDESDSQDHCDLQNHDLSKKAYEALKFLIQNDAYKSMEELCRIWFLKRFQSLAEDIIQHIRSFPQRIYSDETEVSSFYLNEIRSSHHFSPILNDFFAVETEALGDCFYHAISICLTGNGSLSTALRFATVAAIIEHRDLLEAKVRHRFYEGLRTIQRRDYICLLEDLAFSAGFCSSFFKVNTNELRWPSRLNKANLHNDEKGTIQYGKLFHQFIASIIINRPIHCYGSLINPMRAQRILWKYEFENRPPIHFIHVCNNHFVALLPKTQAATHRERYTYFCYFMHDEDNITFLRREITPPNELSSNNGYPVVANVF